MKELGKIGFPVGNIKLRTHWKSCAYNRFLALGKALNVFIYKLLFYPSTQYVK